MPTPDPPLPGPYDFERRWCFTTLDRGIELVSPLWLYWEARNDFITDDYAPETATPAELWSAWRNHLETAGAWAEPLGAPWVDIYWGVRGEAKAERAPFQAANADQPHFLSYYSWPVAEDSGEALNFLRLPVVDKLWRVGEPDKGGFIQEHTGWKPSAYQPYFSLAQFYAAWP